MLGYRFLIPIFFVKWFPDGDKKRYKVSTTYMRMYATKIDYDRVTDLSEICNKEEKGEMQNFDILEFLIPREY